jgi:hypothetical protein
VTVEVAVPPGATGVGGVAEIVKFAAFTVRSTVAECVMPEEGSVPITVIA